MSALKPEDIPTKKSGISSIQDILKRSSGAQKCQPDTTKSSSGEDESANASRTCVNQAIDTNVSESRRSRRASNHPGIVITPSGKWGVQIQHPFIKKKSWVGCFDSFEEATSIYNRKKLEYTSLLKAKQNDKLKRQPLVVEGITVYPTTSGKWGAQIRDPVLKRTLWLGSYPTPEGAVESYNRKKLEFDSTEVRLDLTGKWVATIQHPIRKCRLWLGLFDDPQEAAEVYDKKKVELDTLLHNVKNACSKSDTANQESCFDQKETSADVASPTAGDSEGPRVKKCKGVRLLKSGRWMSHICDPYYSQRNIYLGTFNTAEDAAEAFKRKQREFDVMVSLEKKQKQERDAPAPKRKKLNANSKSEKVVIIEDVAKALPQSHNQQPKVEVCELIQTGLNNTSPSFTSTVTVVNSQDIEGSKKKKKKKQTPCFSLEAEHLVAGIINGYGQLIGDYSRLDDELWLNRPGDDDDLVGIKDLGWEHKPSPFLAE